MYLSPLVFLFHSCLLFNLGFAVKVQQLQQQCDCDPSGPVLGTLCPVTPTYDDNCKLDTSLVPPYAKYLEDARMNGIIVNTPQMGSLHMTMSEKIQNVNAWCDYKKKFGFPYTVACQLGEDDFNDTMKLAAQYASSCCDVIVAGPPLNYPPSTVEELVDYLVQIAKICPSKPFMYSELLFPQCEFIYNSAKISVLLDKLLDNYYGTKCTFESCLVIQSVVKNPSFAIISESLYDVAGAYAFCFNGSSTTIANVVPELVVLIQQYYLSKEDFKSGVDAQKTLNCFASEILDVCNRPERLDRSELGYEIQIIRNTMEITTGLKIGELPYPAFPKVTRNDKLRLYEICQKYGFAKKSPFDDYDYSSPNNKNKNPKGKKATKSPNYGSKGWGDD